MTAMFHEAFAKNQFRQKQNISETFKLFLSNKYDQILSFGALQWSYTTSFFTESPENNLFTRLVSCTVITDAAGSQKKK